jgi:hypothetical protein
MSNPSNLYAEKVFAEHPTGLWALDDKADYISLISEADRVLSNSAKWSITGGTVSAYPQSVDEPFTGSYVGKITATPTSNDFASVVMISKETEETKNLQDLNKYLKTFSVGGYFYSESSYISGFEIGYQYDDTTSGQTITHLKNYDTIINNSWVFISETFDTPPDDTKIRLVFKINFLGGSETEDVFLVNGLTFGQWSEEFASTSLGVTPIDISDKNIAVTTEDAIVAKCYGLQELDGYYLVSDNMLKAKNVGVPMVYGTSGLTAIYPNENDPSLIIPGVGLLNESGKFRQYTLEAWIRINSYSSERKRIIGPIASSDGIYVDGPSIGLRINNEYKTYYVGEWTRPMLVHMKIGEDLASLLINGQEVISLTYSTESLLLPTMTSQGKDQDWIGFYAYEDISPIELDCVGIYPYLVSSSVAKRRFVFGQGVDIPENINTSYSGTSVFIDYSFADYTANYSYPNIGSWAQGFSDNMGVSKGTLFALSHPLPEIVLSSGTKEELFLDCKTAQTPGTKEFFSFKPDSSWNLVSGYLFFENFDFLNTPVSGFYGCFELPESSSSVQTLFRIEKENTKDYFLIQLLNNQISYKISSSGIEETIYTPLLAVPGEMADVGLDIPTFVSKFGNPASNFFGSLSDLRMYVGGNKDGQSTFKGKIYKAGFCTKYNFQKIRGLFNEIGVPIWNEDLFDIYQNSQLIGIDGGIDTTSMPPYGGLTDTVNGGISGGPVVILEEDSLVDHIASYTLLPEIVFDEYKLAVSTNAYWEDQLPLTYFAESVIDKRGDQYFDLDFIQFNIDYPIPSKTIAIETEPEEWTYAELSEQYGTPVQRTYTSLDNYLFTGYNDYEDLKNKISKEYKYDTDESLLKSYVTFQYTELGANQTSFYFTKTERPSRDGVLVPGADWMTTKYEVVNNMIIYPPTGVDFNDLSIVTHLEVNLKNSERNNVIIKKLFYASQALNESDASPIGTRFGTDIYPYTKSGIYYDFKKNNPFSIYTGSSPYLYLTKDSGIQLKGKFDPLINRGLLIPINESRAEGFKVIAMQMAVRFDGDYFPYAPTQIFEIQSQDSYIKFYMVACDPTGRRAKIYALDARTGLVQDGIGFYWNGKIVKEPIITLQEWGFLGINFLSSLNFSFFEGAVRLTGPLLFNSISYYQSTNLQEVQNISERPWFRVRVLGSSTQPLNWDFWESPAFNWNKVLVLSEKSYYGVDPSDVYKSYTGTNKIIVDDERPISIGNYSYTIFTDVNWNQFVQDPV